MPKFLIARAVPPGATREDVDAAALTSIMAFGLAWMSEEERSRMPNGFGDVIWHRSYWEPNGDWGACIYEGPDAGRIAIANEICHLDFEAIERVDESTAHGPLPALPLPPGRSALALFLGPSDKVAEIGTENVQMILGSLGLPNPDARRASIELQWQRTYRRNDGSAVGQYEGPEATVDAIVAGVADSAMARKVVEFAPEEYVTKG